MRAGSAPNRPHVLIVEFGGVGGVWDTCVALGLALAPRCQGVDLASPVQSSSPIRPVRVRSAESVQGEPSASPRRLSSRAMRAVRYAGQVVATTIGVTCVLWSRGRDYELISIQGRYFPPVVALAVAVASAKGGGHVIYTPHNTFARAKGLAGRLDDWFIGLAIRLSDRIVVHGQEVPPGAGGEKPVGIAPLLPPEHASAARRSADEYARKSPLRLVTPGYMRGDKGIVPFASALSTTHDVRYRVVGEAVDPAVVADLERLEHPNIEVQAGYLSETALVREISSADAVVLPYVRSSGSAILEAAVSLGTPVIATPFEAAVEWERLGAAVLTGPSMEPGELEQTVKRFNDLPDAAVTAAIGRGHELAAEREEAAAAAYLSP